MRHYNVARPHAALGYQPPDDRYSRAIVNELLPKLYTEYRITRDPERHANRRLELGRDRGVHGGLGACSAERC